MRINGRILRPTTLAERRVLLSLGQPTFRVPRGINPYVVARKLARAARDSRELLFVRDIQAGKRHRPKPPPPRPSPDVDHPEFEGAVTHPVE